MSFLDIIRNLFRNNKKIARIETTNFTKTFGTSDAFKLILKENDNPLANKDVEMEINGRKYTKKTDDDGVASLNINLPCGTYPILILFEDDEYKQVTAQAKINVLPVISTQDITMQEEDGSQFIAIASSATGVRLENIPITFKINGVKYERETKDNGEAGLNIKLPKGDYNITTSYKDISNENVIHITERPKVPTRIEGTNVNKAKSDPLQYQCAVYDDKGRVAGTVKLTINGRTYEKTPNSEGLYKLNINLPVGSYQLTAQYLGDKDHLGSQVVNTIVIVEDPPKGEYNPIRIQYQPNAYTCGPTSLAMCSQILGKSTSISSFSNACYTDSSGTAPNDLIAGARKLGFKLQSIPRNYDGVKNAIDAGKPIVAHIKTRGVSCLGWVNDYGHYVVIFDYDDGYYHVADPTKGIAWCRASMIDNATYNYEGIKYYSVELL